MYFSITSTNIFAVKWDEGLWSPEGDLLSLLLSRCGEMRMLTALQQLQQIQQRDSFYIQLYQPTYLYLYIRRRPPNTARAAAPT
jgi:hypothetical protein